ncbi:type II toxin-antitoxin system HicA family toxin [Niveibacterium umoris]|uniref:Type II toxin-antitoxin system HicA family toxin n=1 Tax=Niveibacterium umoris TaxID=1193620 RepID=A0A840BJM0_9RHOO|nr:type II toxin-antitoxin system HicA family toxin [Niveibacterium umoris]MBB4013445.1 hypothetical protein [Niveibacterium umoris]
MSHRHAQLLRTIFHDPPSANLHWRDIESLLRHVGAELEQLSGARIRVKLGRAEEIVHHPHHSNTLAPPAVKHLREVLARGGVTPGTYEADG